MTWTFEKVHAPVGFSSGLARFTFAILLAACGVSEKTGDSESTSPADPASPARDQSNFGGPGAHIMPVRTSGTPTVQTAAALIPHLTYHGGRLVSNVDVVQVLYGSGTYASFVSGTSTPNLATLFSNLTNSAYFDWLTEYNTTFTGGTSQIIGRGTFNQRVQITPAAINNGAVITDQSIQNELNAQITAGTLPPATGNTVYMVNFPQGKVIDINGADSCSAFCGYHSTLVRSSTSIGYAVLPDMSIGSHCESSCGAGTPFDSQTYVTSHELIETVTDLEVGLATVVGPPLAWYDSSNGEIGDICGAQEGLVVGGDGVSYTVQTEWSNRTAACTVTRPMTSTEFFVALDPTAATVTAGSVTSLSVNTVGAPGLTQTITLSVSGLPAGVTGAFVPATVAPGSSSTLTLTATTTAAVGISQFVVTGTTITTSRTAGGQLTVSAPANLVIVNGGFETGDFTGWVRSGATAIVTTPHSGSFAGRAGSPTVGGESRLRQTFTAPAGSPTLGFWYQGHCTGTPATDSLQIKLSDNTGGGSTNLVNDSCQNTGTWVNVNASLIAGHSYELRVTNQDSVGTTPSFTLLDDVTVQ